MKAKEMKTIVEIAINEDHGQNAKFTFDLKDPKDHSYAMGIISLITKQGYIAKVYGEIEE